MILELLAPAGGPAQFNAALAAGADAIYCALGRHFNARRGATSFDDESFAAACRKAHLAGARVYVTCNVLIRTDEMSRALALVRRAWLLGADAMIIQDWGLLFEIRRRWPEIECHLSTQANVHDGRAVAWCRTNGLVERVTLSRELSLKEIACIAQEGVMLEGFGHGALCFCYSGICLMSSLSGGRSANRGACAQPCRLPYDVVDEKGTRLLPGEVLRPLCPKDYRMIDHLAALADAGLGSLKIEGRLKSSDYVHAVVKSYREALNELEGEAAPSQEKHSARKRSLRRAFNRDFTDAYLHGRSGNEMMSYERSNNRGELVGTVLASRDLGSSRVRRGGGEGGRERFRTVRRAEVDVLLSAPVGAGDLLELRPLDEPSAFLASTIDCSAQAGETICCKTARPMPQGSAVRVIRSQAALDAASRVERSLVPRRRAVEAHVVVRQGMPFELRLTCVDGAAQVELKGPVVEPARTRELSEQDLIEHVGRMGGSPFEAHTISVELGPGCGMSFSQVHKLRAEACRALSEKLLAPYSSRELAAAPTEARVRGELLALQREREAKPCQGCCEVCALAASPKAARAALQAGATRIYVPADALAAEKSGWPEGVIPWLDEVCREDDHAHLDPWIRAGKPVAVGNISELALAQERGALAELRSCIPVHNSSALDFFESQAAAAVWLSPELALDEIAELAKASTVPLGLVVWGRTRAMTSEHCILQVLDECINDCENCPLRRTQIFLQGTKGQRYPVQSDIHGRSRVYAAEPLDASPYMHELLACGIAYVMVDGTLLSPDELSQAVRHVCAQRNRACAGQLPTEAVQGATSGHLFQRIG